jgi:hypothetical protein
VKVIDVDDSPPKWSKPPPTTFSIRENTPIVSLASTVLCIEIDKVNENKMFKQNISKLALI